MRLWIVCARSRNPTGKLMARPQGVRYRRRPLRAATCCFVLALAALAMLGIASPEASAKTAFGSNGFPPAQSNPRAMTEAEPRAFISCGYPPTRSFGITSEGAISYREHPARCSYSDDGTTLHTISLEDLRWKDWGKPTARAFGRRVDNHDQDRNGFQRHNVRVVVSGLRPAVGHQGTRKLYYTRLEVLFGESRSYTWPLYRPGMGVMRPRLGREIRRAPIRVTASQINECGDLPSRFAYNITTRKAACWKAREVIRRWGKTVAQEGGDGSVGSYYCRYQNIGYEAGDIRCTASRGRVVHWQTGV